MVVLPWSMWAIMPMSRMFSFLFMSLRISVVCLNLGMFVCSCFCVGLHGCEVCRLLTLLSVKL